MEYLTIPARFNGPPESGNGGYSSGAVAAYIDGVARVRLHAPPPLDVPLSVYRLDAGAVEVRDGERLIASGGPAHLDIELPPAPTLSDARRGRERFPYREDHYFPTCFVCGNGRPAGDGLEIFTGPVDGWELVASTWRPAPDLLDEAGNVRSEFIWAALDCPGCFGALGDSRTPVLLGEQVLRQFAAVPGDRDLVIYAWPLGGEGRKHYGGAAIANQEGEALACSRTTWITVNL